MDCAFFQRATMLTLALLVALPAVGDASDEHRFLRGDEVEVLIWDQPDLSGRFRIGADGSLRIPLVGKIKADGLSEEALTQAIEESVSGFVRSPRIMVSPLYSVSVFGAVSRPGRYYIDETDDVVSVLGMAGGLTPTASGRLSLLRGGDQHSFTLRKILLTGETGRLRLQSGDILFVGEKPVTLQELHTLLLTLSSVLTVTLLIVDRMSH